MMRNFLGFAVLGLAVMSGAVPQALDDVRGLPLLASFDFENGQAPAWRPNEQSRWRVASKDGSMVFELIAPGTLGKLRAPTSWAVLGGHDVASFIFRGRLQCDADPANDKRDMCVFFNFKDPAHFGYVHFSASSDEFHNIIALVNGTDRTKINREPPGKSVYRLTDRSWHEFKVTGDEPTGEIQAYLDDMTRPILTARETALGHGLVGVGSFDDTGRFDDLKLWGKLK